MGVVDNDMVGAGPAAYRLVLGRPQKSLSLGS